MQIEQVEQKGIFRQAQVTGGQGSEPVDRVTIRNVKKADEMTG